MSGEMKGGCIPNCIACRPVLPESRRAEAEARWAEIRRTLADPYARPPETSKGKES